MKQGSQVTIRRPIGEVFGFVSGPENLRRWRGGVAGATQACRGPMGLGAMVEVLRDGTTDAECWEVIEYEPPRALAVRLLDGSDFLQCRYTLQNVEGCTRLTLEVYSGAGISPEPSPLLQQAAERRLEADLARLREVLENRVGEAGMRDGDAAVGAHSPGRTVSL